MARSKLGRYQGVTAFIGMPGSGKTYGLAEVAYYARRRGVPTYCNDGFDVEGAQVFSTFPEFIDVIAQREECVIVFDELPLYFNARKWQEFPDAVLYYLTQIRKCRARLYYSAIHESMVDVNIRRLTFFYWHCRAVTGRLLRRAMWPPEEFRKAKQKPIKREFVRVSKRIASTYDTMGTVAVSEKTAASIAKSVSGQGSWVKLGAAADSPAALDSAGVGAPAPEPAVHHSAEHPRPGVIRV